uniref:FAD-binding protein n=1 Tax=Roseihalotalea indica TaxID=2867963 RepID=A0AA49GUJ8_9BACT|nr:FAD-binding protein [Tunicatimonas sp. TK19036]
MKTRNRITWSNVIKKHQVEPFKYLTPGSLEDIVAAVQEAEACGHRIRAVGSGHSYSDIAITDGHLVDMSRLNRLLELDKDRLHLHHQEKYLVEVEGGITVEKLNRQLDRQRLALINMGAIDEQTISGAIATGTHGSGRNLPAMSGMVRSLMMVATEGKKYRIEPSEGFTDPNQHKEADTELIQDDDTFYSAVVSMGCMGIVYSYILEVRPRYWLYENRCAEKWSEVRQKLADGSMFDDYPILINGQKVERPIRSVFIVVNPYEKDGDHTCMVARTFEVDRFQFRTLRDRTRNILATIVSNIPLAYRISLFVVNNLPKLVPAALERSMTALKDTTYVHKSYKVLFQGFEYVASQGHGAEFAYNRHETTYLDVMDKIFAKVAQLSEKYKLYPSSAPTLRFVKSSPIYLTPEHETDVCYIGNPVLVRQKGATLILNEYQDINLEAGGKPHWGKITNRLEGRTELIRQWYPKFETWRQVMLRFNPNRTFLNSFAERMRLDEP